MKKTLMLMIMTVPVAALAQVSTGTSGPGLDQVVSEGFGVFTTWRGLGWLAGLAGLVNFFITLTKFGPLRKLISDTGKQWLRPLIALVLGVTGGVLSALVGGVPWTEALLTGVVAGVAAPGMHELLGSIKSAGTKAKPSGG